jgi:transposase InsO family protein
MVRTTPEQRRRFHQRHKQGESYPAIANSEGVNRATVRYWCRRLRRGGSGRTIYRRQPAGLLARFDPVVRYAILRLRLEHPRWGPNRIRERLKTRPSVRGRPLPSEASIGRYLHQWPCFRRQPSQKVIAQRLNQPTQVHQRWQLDFKLDIALGDGTLATLHTVRDPVGEVALGAVLFPAKRVGQRTEKVTVEQARSTLRHCFAAWHALPDEVQTDGEPKLVGQKATAFPTPFTLWLTGLGIQHLVTRPGRPTDNSEVERCHRTLNEYAIVGNQGEDLAGLQAILNQSIYELAFELPSRAEGCHGRPPAVAHPELSQPRRVYAPELELALFDPKRVDAYLATFTWERQVGKNGQITLGGRHQRVLVGRDHGGQQVKVRFDPADRHFVFYQSDGDEDKEVGRRRAPGLEVSDLTGLAEWPLGLGPQQLVLPLFTKDGVSC